MGFCDTDARAVRLVSQKTGAARPKNPRPRGLRPAQLQTPQGPRWVPAIVAGRRSEPAGHEVDAERGLAGRSQRRAAQRAQERHAQVPLAVGLEAGQAGRRRRPAPRSAPERGASMSRVRNQRRSRRRPSVAVDTQPAACSSLSRGVVVDERVEQRPGGGGAGGRAEVEQQRAAQRHLDPRRQQQAGGQPGGGAEQRVEREGLALGAAPCRRRAGGPARCPIRRRASWSAAMSCSDGSPHAGVEHAAAQADETAGGRRTSRRRSARCRCRWRRRREGRPGRRPRSRPRRWRPTGRR